MAWPRRKATCSSGKSVPTTAVRRTGLRNEAATEKYDAAPPSTSTRRSLAVSTESRRDGSDDEQGGVRGEASAAVMIMASLTRSAVILQARGTFETRMVADADIADLIAAGDYVGAAARAVAEGDLRRAITLYERVWRFAEALPLAERLGDPALAIRLALDAGDGARAAAIAQAIPADRRAELDAASAAFAGRARFAEGAELAERAGSFERAAALYRRGGLPLAAARALERAGLWNDAGRLYEQVAREAAEDGDGQTAAEAQLALGALLGRLGRPRDAVRALQAAARHPRTTEAAAAPAVPGAGRPGPAPRRRRDRPPPAPGAPRAARQRRGHRRAGAAGAQRPGAVGRAPAPVRRAAADRRGHAGAGLPGRGSPAGRDRGAEDPGRGRGRQRRGAAGVPALRARGGGRQPPAPPQRGPPARRRRAGRHPGAGVPAGRHAGHAPWPSTGAWIPPAVRRLALELLSALAASPPGGHRPPGREAGQRVLRCRRQRQAGGLRGQPPGGLRRHADGGVHRHPRLPEPRADLRRAHRPGAPTCTGWASRCSRR